MSASALVWIAVQLGIFPDIYLEVCGEIRTCTWPPQLPGGQL